MLNTAILFLIFKRPNITAQVFEVIRKAQPARLYIAADGARANQADDTEKVSMTRQVVLCGIDWPCEVKTLFRETNLGCRIAVSSAIDWFFEHEEEGIILEDDCLPDLSFFKFCEELLEYYRYDTRIMAISGDNFQKGQQRGIYSYYFSQLPHCWGWATWRRAWKLYNISIENFDEIIAEMSCREFTHNTIVNKFYYNNIVRSYQKEIDSWAYLWMFATAVNHGLSILPQRNIVANIGFGADATHTVKNNKKIPAKKSMVFPLNHPSYMCLNKEADMFYYNNFLKLPVDLYKKPSIYSSILRFIKNHLKL